MRAREEGPRTASAVLCGRSDAATIQIIGRRDGRTTGHPGHAQDTLEDKRDRGEDAILARILPPPVSWRTFACCRRPLRENQEYSSGVEVSGR